MTTRRGWGFAALGLAAATAALIAFTAAAAPPRPLLWKVSDSDNHIYLLGSFHLLKASDYPVAATVDAAFQDAEKVVFEISPEEMADPALRQAMLVAATLPAGRTLQRSMSPETWQRLKAYSQRRKLPLAKYQHLEPWFVSLLVSLREMDELGYDSSRGLDQYLIRRSAEARKPTAGLEKAAQQIAAMDSMTPIEQQQSLQEALDDAGNFNAKIARLHGLWRTGDERALEQLMAREFKQRHARLYKRMNTDRNQAWLPGVRRLLDDERSDDALVVVGALHLLGSDGLVAQLKARGYTVERL